ncbi:ead/Ea22-like family protein [Escherichia coli]
MSNIDKRGLREAAEKATKGRWAVEFDDEIYSTDGVNHEQIAMVFSENEARDAAFIAAANPATVLALLASLEAKDKRIAELEVKLQATDKLHDSAFRHGLQHGFSYGQTDDQAGFEQAIQAYGQQWKGE